MSQAALIQLVAVGVEDEYLTKTPEITFFETVYRQHVPFSMQTVPMLFSSGFSFGNTISCNIDRIGDLVGGMTLNIKLDSLKSTNQWVNDLGHTLIEHVELEIGGQVVDKHYGEWLDIWAEFTQPTGKKSGYYEMVYKDVGSLTAPMGLNLDDSDQTKVDFFANSDNNPAKSGARDIYVPLSFWFCRNPGLALPLIALSHHQVKINFQIAPFSKCVTDPHGNKNQTTISSHSANASARLLVNYYYLDNASRESIATKEHKFLVEQLQTTGVISVQKGTTCNRYPLNFSHPVKALFWVFQQDNNDANQNFLYGRVKGASNEAPPLVDAMQLKINGQEFTNMYSHKFFSLLQPYYHNTSIPSISTDLYTFSFGLRPEEHQPTGTLNFSRVENAYLHVNFNKKNPSVSSDSTTGIDSVANDDAIEEFSYINFRCYALNYNVFVVTSGMGGMLYK